MKYRWIFVLAAAGSVWLGAPEPSHAGVYRAAICHPRYSVRESSASFGRDSRHYVGRSRCAAGGEGLEVRHEARRSGGQRQGFWELRAPAGTRFERLRAQVAGVAQGGHRPSLALYPPASAPRMRGHFSPFEREGAFWGLRAALRCARPASGSCGPGRAAYVRMRRIVLRVRDLARPRLSLGGSLLTEGSRRGTQTLEPLVLDAGGGVRRVFVEVNGVPLDARTLGCRLREGVGLGLSPCPNRARPSFSLNTAASPFRQGPNRLRVCAADYAADGAANRSCAGRVVRVDNLCPIGGGPAVGQVRAAFRNGRARATVRYPERARVRGVALDPYGRPAAGSAICVATRVRHRGVAERVPGTVVTDREGRFGFELPRGASREVRVAHWPSSTSVREGLLRLEVRARPRLWLRPRREVENGERLRFKVRLHGPFAAGRRVRVMVRAPGRWIELRRGRATSRGVYRTRYRFRDTSDRQRYRFRAVVPRQKGYPFKAGRSRARTKVVVG